MRNLTGTILLLILFAAGQATAHSGRTDDLGGHHQRAQGTYHFHRGPLAGQTFADKASACEALRRMHQTEAESRQNNRDSAPRRETAPGGTATP